ncbi:polar amino acid transport system substrate-binding protein [Clostridium saccharoperbutylacetonicum]|uniref:Amino acid ABC transporter substrate-binding protein, PAAT family n=1 Tax=Clostridium saccharoperbutylacetonicum N1-4(HMT) TaxID=931276 RepID=M1MHK5_9CLOT|nr:ABC transporter substrate-binding protein [Clostridium saccharoperbutylacetonicum]AGF55778.1 amino acid ABC transporter substrate-binding protein, PAAT family [Clostridium saccharoperbutylacetonicum N1-4(HMT)]NRT63489.1 polar amino acid transport system substrate-binding protein [Clostridium saccharoperbutylacetonicum]NSB26851.1 polar amino acid transport system substrate-binding protein [Clostridium saccharoperbutylacetonicum]NSB40333.1 polar amino acid transport system substrate-binding pr
MKKLVSLIIIIIGFAGIIGGCITKSSKFAITNITTEKQSLETIKEKGLLTIVSPPKEVPFFFINSETNKTSGIDADIITEIAKRLGINKIEVKEAPFSNLLEKLKTDDSIDMAVGGIFITPEREASVDFTKPLYKETETVIVPKYSDINNKSDLKELVIGVERGTIFVDLAQEWKKNNFIKDVMIFESTTDLLNAINLRKVDAGIADSIVVNSFLADGGSYLPLRTLKDYTPEVNGTLGMAVRKADISLLNEVNKIIDDMKADGTLYAILVDNGLNRDNIVPQ